MFWGKPVGRQTANRRPTVGQQTTDSRPTGFSGSSSSQLPLVELYQFKIVGVFQYRYQVVKHFCCCRIVVKDWEIISRQLLQSCTTNNKINKEQSVNLCIFSEHISQVAGKNKCSFNTLVTELSEVSSVVCLLLNLS